MGSPAYLIPPLWGAGSGRAEQDRRGPPEPLLSTAEELLQLEKAGPGHGVHLEGLETFGVRAEGRSDRQQFVHPPALGLEGLGKRERVVPAERSRVGLPGGFRDETLPVHPGQHGLYGSMQEARQAGGRQASQIAGAFPRSGDYLKDQATRRGDEAPGCLPEPVRVAAGKPDRVPEGDDLTECMGPERRPESVPPN